MEDDVIDYLTSHYEDIHADMETRMSSGDKKTEHTRKKRHELSHSATKSLKKHDVKIMVSFE
jgi:radical SAM superfamily enzyme